MCSLLVRSPSMAHCFDARFIAALRSYVANHLITDTFIPWHAACTTGDERELDAFQAHRQCAAVESAEPAGNGWLGFRRRGISATRLDRELSTSESMRTFDA
jgi:hypothetical protein